MAPTTGLGVDLARVERFRRLMQADNLAVVDRIFTAGEKAYALARKDPAPHLAARFAAKEAFLKALGLGLRDGISWQQMEVTRDELGKPSLQLTGRAAEIYHQRGYCRLLLSYSHDGDYAFATVLLEGP